MRAQKIEDPSMEDILSSIRKIISEDEKESGNNSFAADTPTPREQTPAREAPQQEAAEGPLTSAFMQGRAAPQQNVRDDDPENLSNSEAIEQAYRSELEGLQNRQGQSESRPREFAVPERPAPQPRQPISNYQASPTPRPEPAASQIAEAIDRSPAPETRVELNAANRHESQDSGLLQVVKPARQTEAAPQQEVAPKAESRAEFAEKPNPMLRPAVQTTPPERSGLLQEAAPDPISERPIEPPAPKREAGQIPGFVESKPDAAAIRERQTRPAEQKDEDLHPAIANAKSYIAIKENAKTAAPVNAVEEEKQHTPVFKESAPSSVNLQTEQLISPDSVERRSNDERRTHPMRREADRDEREFKNELMSPSASDSVHTAFEQLKNMATENLDANVKELIRPMLKEWLDNNLPSMVERLVRDEIERVSRGD